MTVHSMWAQILRITRPENLLPHASGLLFHVVVQFVLLYGSKTWCMTMPLLRKLEGFQTPVAYGMAVKHVPREAPGSKWTYPQTTDVME